jgi:hypothetical protein
MTNEKDYPPSEITVILTGKNDLTGQAMAAAYALKEPWLKGDYRIIQKGNDLYAVKYNKKSIRVWPQGEHYGT